MSDEKKPTGILAIGVAVVAILVGAFWLYRNVGTKPAGPALPTTARATNGPSKDPIRIQTAQRWTPQEALSAALAEFDSEADIMRREERLESWLSEIEYGDIADFIALLDKEPASKLNNEIKLRLFRKMAGNNPAEAAALVMLQPAGADRQALLNAVGTVWAGTNIPDAIVWARELPQDERGGVFLRIAQEAIGSDPRQALELAREIPPSESRNELVAHIAGEWAMKKPEEIAGWAEKIEDSALREQVLSHVAIAWGETDPAKAAELAVGQLSAGKPQNDAVVGIVQRWVQSRPAEAAAWVAQFSEGELRETAVRELVNLWADKNISDAGKWVNELPPGNSKDTAVGAYVGKIASAHPETAAQWVAGIADEQLRNRQMERVAETWLEKDASAAREWIKSSPLPDEVKEKFLAEKAK